MKSWPFNRISDYNHALLSSVILVLLAGVGFTGAMTLAKMVDRSLPSHLIICLRCLFGFIFFIPFALKQGALSFQTKRPYLHVLRIVFICLAMLCTYTAYRGLPIATASAIGFTGPLFTAVLAKFILKDGVSPKKWIAIFMGYLGVLIAVHPSHFSLNTHVYIAFLANLFAAFAIITTKKLSSTESASLTLCYSNFAAFFFFAIPSLTSWQMPQTHDLLLLFGIGILGALSQFFSFTALRSATASFLAPFEYTRLIFAVLLGYVFFQEIPSLPLLAGSLLIISSNLYLIFIESKK